MEVRATGCCGMKELVDISKCTDPQQVVSHYTNYFREYGGGAPFVIFTGVVKRVRKDHASNRPDNYGEALATYITEHKLGEVVTTLPERKNVSGNTLKLWLWMPDYTALYGWQMPTPANGNVFESRADRMNTAPSGPNISTSDAAHNRVMEEILRHELTRNR